MDPVVIVGAGLAGLSCAQQLTRAGVPVRVLEAADAVGGRVRTDIVDGFRLDRGFQVLLSAYPTTRAAVDLRSLDPRPFYSGALVVYAGGRHRIAHPLRHPRGAAGTLASPLISPRDGLALARLIARARGPLPLVFAQPELTTEEALQRAGISQRLLDGFFRPFFGGVFLDLDLRTSSRMLDFLLRMFAKGPAVVPAHGMQRIPEALARTLPPGTVSVNACVATVDRRQVQLTTGETIAAAAVVVATDGADAAALTGEIAAPAFNESTTLYYAADHPPLDEPTLLLDGDASGAVNSVAVMSNVSPAYAPAGQALISASLPGPGPAPATGPADADAELERTVRTDLERFFGDQARSFRHLRTYRIPRALPAQPPGVLEPPARPVTLASGLYIAGDHRENGSIEGAIVSGRRAAAAVLQDRLA